MEQELESKNDDLGKEVQNKEKSIRDNFDNSKIANEGFKIGIYQSRKL